MSDFLSMVVPEEAKLAHNHFHPVAVHHILQQIRVNFGNVLKDSLLRVKTLWPYSGHMIHSLAIAKQFI